MVESESFLYSTRRMVKPKRRSLVSSIWQIKNHQVIYRVSFLFDKLRHLLHLGKNTHLHICSVSSEGGLRAAESFWRCSFAFVALRSNKSSSR